MDEEYVEAVLTEFAAKMHHNWQHPTWTYGEDRDPCPFIFDWVPDPSDEKFTPLVDDAVNDIKRHLA